MDGWEKKHLWYSKKCIPGERKKTKTVYSYVCTCVAVCVSLWPWVCVCVCICVLPLKGPFSQLPGFHPVRTPLWLTEGRSSSKSFIPERMRRLRQHLQTALSTSADSTWWAPQCHYHLHHYGSAHLAVWCSRMISYSLAHVIGVMVYGQFMGISSTSHCHVEKMI